MTVEYELMLERGRVPVYGIRWMCTRFERNKENSHAERTVGVEPVTLTGIIRDSY